VEFGALALLGGFGVLLHVDDAEPGLIALAVQLLVLPAEPLDVGAQLRDVALLVAAADDAVGVEQL
jgi:hypothetical protein